MIDAFKRHWKLASALLFWVQYCARNSTLGLVALLITLWPPPLCRLSPCNHVLHTLYVAIELCPELFYLIGCPSLLVIQFTILRPWLKTWWTLWFLGGFIVFTILLRRVEAIQVCVFGQCWILFLRWLLLMSCIVAFQSEVLPSLVRGHDVFSRSSSSQVRLVLPWRFLKRFPKLSVNRSLLEGLWRRLWLHILYEIVLFMSRRVSGSFCERWRGDALLFLNLPSLARSPSYKLRWLSWSILFESANRSFGCWAALLCWWAGNFVPFIFQEMLLACVIRGGRVR